MEGGMWKYVNRERRSQELVLAVGGPFGPGGGEVVAVVGGPSSNGGFTIS